MNTNMEDKNTENSSAVQQLLIELINAERDSRKFAEMRTEKQIKATEKQIAAVSTATEKQIKAHEEHTDKIIAAITNRVNDNSATIANIFTSTDRRIQDIKDDKTFKLSGKTTLVITVVIALITISINLFFNIFHLTR